MFISNCHQRYEHGKPVLALQNCVRIVNVYKNENGWQGFMLEPGFGYIVSIINGEAGIPQMSDKPMEVIRETETSIELRGYPVLSDTPFGMQEVDFSDYGLMIYFEHGKVSKCCLHMFDRDTCIEYRNYDNSNLVHPDGSNFHCPECEQYAKMSQSAAVKGNTSLSHRYGLQLLNSLVANPLQINAIDDVPSVALSLGRLMEGDYVTGNEKIIAAVGLSYFFLTKAIVDGHNDPYLYVYRFSLIYEYNKAMYHIFAESEGNSFYYSPIFGQEAKDLYEERCKYMQMADMFSEPRIGQIDPAVSNIFRRTYAQYCATPKDQIVNRGKKYHEQIFAYLESKIKKLNFDF